MPPRSVPRERSPNRPVDPISPRKPIRRLCEITTGIATWLRRPQKRRQHAATRSVEIPAEIRQLEGKIGGKKYLRTRLAQNLLRFLDVAGKSRFLLDELRKAGILVVWREKNRDDFGLLESRLFEIEPFSGILPTMAGMTKYLGFLLVQKSVDFRQLSFELFLARHQHVQFRAFFLEGNILAGKLLAQRAQHLLRKNPAKNRTSNSRLFSFSWSISD